MTRSCMNISNEPVIVITPEATYIDGYEFCPKSITVICGTDRPRESVTIQELVALAKC